MHTQSIAIPSMREERWELFDLTQEIKLEANKKYFLSIHLFEADAKVYFYYSTADPYKNGDMLISDLSIKECDMSFFLQSKDEYFMKEIQWLEENDYGSLVNSPMALEEEQVYRFKIQCYPKPFDRVFMVSTENLNTEEPLLVALTNLSGTVLWMNSYNIEKENKILTITLELNLPSGKYNLRVSQKEQVRYTTIISR